MALKYRYGGREKVLALGQYPDVSLKRAREKRQAARDMLDRGLDPSAEKRAEKGAQADTFRSVAEEWLKKQKTGLSESTLGAAESRLKTWVYPQIGNWPIRDIEPPDVLRVLRRIESLGKHETAHRVKNRIGQVFRFAVASGRATRDPTADLKDALAPVPTENRSAITDPVKVGEMLRAIDSYQGQPSVMYALRLAPYVFVRAGELRAAKWSEFDLEAAEWRIPPEKTKMGRLHIVPLSKQVLAILEELYAITGTGPDGKKGGYLFPSIRSTARAISDNTLNAALRRLGYDKTEHVAHGFRGTASTLLHELGFNELHIEAQLAHIERSKVKRAYNHAKYLSQRRKMMQSYADYLDGLKAGGKVSRIKS